jgi:glycosyltransferase involved in cell wall biosynthesis
MRVLFLQQQPCIRALKYASALRDRRPEVRLGFACQGRTLSEWYGTGDSLFERWWRIGAEPDGDLRRVMDEWAPDVIHSHNLPDRLTVIAGELADGRVPVIHDAHDMQSLRRTPYEDGFPEPADPLELERRAVEGSAAVVSVSPEMLDEMAARYRLPGSTPCFANYALERDLPRELPPPLRRRDGVPRLVYQGTLSTNDGHYDLRELFTAIVREGVSLDIYPARPAPEYQRLARALPGLRVHETLEPAPLLQELAQYDFGWAGFNDGLNRAHLDTALPNKVYEYLGCGLPVLTLAHRALARLVRDEGIGVSLTSLDGLAAQLAELDVPGLRQRVADSRSRLTVEANVDRVAELYEEVAG